nr:uncharacterized protein LOC113818807 [Penaeus vannamei]
MGAQQVTSLVFFLYIFRLLGLSVVGAYGPAWATLLVEFLNGPCYGLGYTAIVVYAAKISPPGTSNTVQSVVNICYESFGYATASLVGGVLYQQFGGPRMYLIFGSVSILVFLLHVLSLRFLPPPEGMSRGWVVLLKGVGCVAEGKHAFVRIGGGGIRSESVRRLGVSGEAGRVELVELMRW